MTSNIKSIAFLLLLFLYINLQAQVSPDRLYGDLFKEVQMQRIFEDSKTFPDCIPRTSPAVILEAYEKAKKLPDFDLRKFVLAHFLLPGSAGKEFQSDTSSTVTEHIEKLWPVLTRQPDTCFVSSLIALPYPYVVPGGRFREIYYWDSYFTMLGLRHSGHEKLLESMIRNFTYLIDTLGFIPNGNRTYYLSRSQPPFYALMIQLLAEKKGKDVLVQYLPFLEKEYHFWMSGTEHLNQETKAYRRVVRMQDNSLLNRYWDDRPQPRPESFYEDSMLALTSSRKPEALYRDLRAACESGWDFSSRWLKKADQLESIHTTDLIPVDLNCLMLYLERTLAEGYARAGDKHKQDIYKKAAQRRHDAILRYCWDEKNTFFTDYDFTRSEATGFRTPAGLFPLFFGICSKVQAKYVRNEIMQHFLKEGGLVTSLDKTGQQWDMPNGWAPLQWIAVKGLLEYGYTEDALRIAGRWLHLNEAVYRITGKMLEKYNVADIHCTGGGGEYPLQDGFGWTNGVFLKLFEYRDKALINKTKNQKKVNVYE